MQTKPLVSIGMPIKNCSQTVKLAIKSILYQTYKNWELIIVDDGSSDNTPEIVRKIKDKRIRLYCGKKSLGVGSRLNQVIKLSRGEYFARMDGDDISYPKRFEKQLSYLQNNPQVNLIGSSMLIVDRSNHIIGKRIYPSQHSEISRFYLFGIPIAHTTFFGKISFFRKYHYNGSIPRSQDQELLFRTINFNTFANYPEILYAYYLNVSLKKYLISRYYLLKGFLKNSIKQKKILNILIILLSQIVKIICDLIQAIFNFKFTLLLRYHAKKYNKSELIKWQEVKKLLKIK